MQRTSQRPLAAGRMSAAEGLSFGLALCLASYYILAGFVNLTAALLSLAGIFYYVLFYSLWLKKATVQNIVIGGGAGAIPPMVGWAAATGHLSLAAWILFLIIFMWTPPHFWALAIVRSKDYARGCAYVASDKRRKGNALADFDLYFCLGGHDTVVAPHSSNRDHLPCLCDCAWTFADLRGIARLENPWQQSGMDNVSLVEHVFGIYISCADD